MSVDASLLSLEYYGLTGPTPLQKWREILPEKIWPRSRFALQPPETAGSCGFAGCVSNVKALMHEEEAEATPKPHSDKPSFSKKPSCKRCGITFCKKACYANAKDLHAMLCNVEMKPEEIPLFLFSIINTKKYEQVVTMANLVWHAIKCAASDERILPEGFEFNELAREEGQTDEAYDKDLSYTLVERVTRMLAKTRIAFYKAELKPPNVVSPSSSSSYAGLVLFIVVGLMTGGKIADRSMATLLTCVMKQTLAAPPGVSLFTLEQGQITPGMVTGDGPSTLCDLYEKDAAVAHMSAAYLILLVPVDYGAGTPLSALLWRVGEVGHLQVALPGHYTLADWMTRREHHVDKEGYATKFMTHKTVVSDYLADLTLLVDAHASESSRREAFCRAFGLREHKLHLASLGVDCAKRDALPIYAVFVCRAFAY